MRHLYRALFVAAVTTFALAGCGGKSSTTQSSAQPTTEAQRETAALPGASMAPVPRTLRCNGQKPVWVNVKRKVYHDVGDPYYGRTHNGQYLCKSDAEAQGYHPAGSRRHHRRHGGAMNDNGADNGADNNPAPEDT